MEEKKLTLREARDTICDLANATEGTENSIIFGYGMGLSTALDLIDKIQEPERISDSEKTETCTLEQIRKRSIFCSNCGSMVEELL